MASAGVILSNKLCPELGDRLAAMTWTQIEDLIKEYIAEDDCQRAQGAAKRIIDRTKTRNYKVDPIKFLSDLVHGLEDEEIYCQSRYIDKRSKVEDQIKFYHGVTTPALEKGIKYG